MDPNTSAQDVIRCDCCDKERATSYCDFCYVQLCIFCIGKHIADDYDKHKVVPIEQRKTTLIYPKCANHQTKNCEFHCKDCNASICSFCTTLSGTHEKHTILTLFDLYNSKRGVIVKDTEVLNTIISPTFEEIAAELETQIDKLDGEYEKLVKVVSNEGEEWHRQINIIIDKMKSETEGIKTKHRSILKSHLDEIKSIQRLIKQTEINLSEIEESNEVSKATEYSSRNKELGKLPSKVQVQMPTFSPKPIDTEQLYNLIGSLSPLSTISNEKGYRFKKSGTTSKELLKEPNLLSIINTGYKNLQSVSCFNDENIWTSARNTKEMKCFNIQGSIMMTVKTESAYWLRDMAASSNGDIFYFDKDKTTWTVNKIKLGKTKEVIRLHGWVPLNLCVTLFGDLLAIMRSEDKTQSKVVRYSGAIEEQTIQFDDENKPLYSGSAYIKYITENNNLDICVADMKDSVVVVVNQTGKFRFRYTGHSSCTKDKSFSPFGITTDSQSHILTADNHNNRIHILDQDGQFLIYIDNCDLYDPYGLSVDKNDNLFVTEYCSGLVKRIQYLK